MPAPPGWKRTPTLPHVALMQAQIAPTQKRKDLQCHTCGARMRLIDGPYSRFYGCRKWPKCTTRIRANWDGTPIMVTKDRPSLTEAMLAVMGDDICTSDEVLQRLSQNGWAPDVHGKAYVSYMLSTVKYHFERLPGKGRASYRSVKRPTWQERLLEDAFDALT